MARPQDLPAKAVKAAPVPARSRVLTSLACGMAAAVPVALATTWELWPLVAWDLAAAVYLLWVWLSIWRLDAGQTASQAVPEDPTRAAADFLTLTAAVASLAAVGFALGRASSSHGTEQTLLTLLGVGSVALSWTVVHTVYTLRYARLYYSDTDGGIQFSDPDPPTYADFAYMSFTIGMTSQVSDTDIESKTIRAEALRQSLLSFLFGTGILATTVNLIANL
jgi:uncharacterized membrane protein